MITVICGMIGAGKTTYAKENYDHVLDFDEIGSKDEQIAQAMTLDADGKDVAYITCYPTAKEMAFFNLADAVRFCWINTTMSQCLKNVTARGRKKDIADLKAVENKNKWYRAKLRASQIPFEYIDIFETNERW